MQKGEELAKTGNVDAKFDPAPVKPVHTRNGAQSGGTIVVKILIPLPARWWPYWVHLDGRRRAQSEHEGY